MHGFILLNGFMFNISEITCCRDFDGGMSIEYKNGREPAFLGCSIVEFNEALMNAVETYQVSEKHFLEGMPIIYTLELPEKGE